MALEKHRVPPCLQCHRGSKLWSRKLSAWTIDEKHSFSMTTVSLSRLPISKICISKFKYMQQAISSNNLTTLSQKHFEISKPASQSLFARFINWCEVQEENRFLWLGIAFMGSIGMVLPLTLVTVFLTSGNLTLVALAAIANVPVLAVNLAAQPTKVTLPFIFSAWLINLSIIVYSLISFLF